MQLWCQPLVFCSDCQPPTASPWSSDSGQETLLWVCRLCRYSDLSQPSTPPKPQCTPAVSLCRGSVVAVDTAKPCKELERLYFNMHCLTLHFTFCRADKAAEPLMELTPLRMQCMPWYSGVLITVVARLQRLCGGFLLTLDAVLLCP